MGYPAEETLVPEVLGLCGFATSSSFWCLGIFPFVEQKAKIESVLLVLLKLSSRTQVDFSGVRK